MRVPEIDLRAKPHKESQPRANGGFNYLRIGFLPSDWGCFQEQPESRCVSLSRLIRQGGSATAVEQGCG